LPGGNLFISWTDANRILMTGPAELEFTGEVEIRPELVGRATI
jgi:diaminopimelate epimerase